VAFDWFSSNVVAVVIIEDQQVVVALAKMEGQLAGKITIAFAGGGLINDSNEKVVGAFAILKGSGKKIRIREQRKSRCLGFSGALVLPSLLEVSLGSGDRIGSVLAERFQGQTRDNFELVGDSWADSKVEGTGESRVAWEKAMSSLILVG